MKTRIWAVFGATLIGLLGVSGCEPLPGRTLDPLAPVLHEKKESEKPPGAAAGSKERPGEPSTRETTPGSQ